MNKVRKFINKLILSDHLNKNLINLINKYDNINLKSLNLNKELCIFCKNTYKCYLPTCRNREFEIKIITNNFCNIKGLHRCSIFGGYDRKLKCLDCGIIINENFKN
jgi:hypothetical protein